MAPKSPWLVDSNHATIDSFLLPHRQTTPRMGSRNIFYHSRSLYIVTLKIQQVNKIFCLSVSCFSKWFYQPSDSVRKYIQDSYLYRRQLKCTGKVSWEVRPFSSSCHFSLQLHFATLHIFSLVNWLWCNKLYFSARARNSCNKRVCTRWICRFNRLWVVVHWLWNLTPKMSAFLKITFKRMFNLM